MNASETSSLIGKSLTWFNENRAALEAAGFPAPVGPLGGWYRVAIVRWLDAQTGHVPAGPDADRDAWVRAAHG